VTLRHHSGDVVTLNALYPRVAEDVLEIVHDEWIGQVTDDVTRLYGVIMVTMKHAYYVAYRLPFDNYTTVFTRTRIQRYGGS